MTSLLEVVALEKTYAPRQRLFGAKTSPIAVRAVDGVTFRLEVGETLALVGESGCGKSTLARLVLRLIEPTSGAVRFEGADITAANEKAMREYRRKMQIVFQDPFASLNPHMTIHATIEEPLLVHGVGDAEARRAAADDLLTLVGLDPAHGRRYPHEFSGGQRQRIGIARALALRPSLVVCDEPVSALDVSVQAQVINLLSDLQKRLHLSYLFISHDLSVVQHVADRVAVMYFGRIVEVATKREIFNNPRHPYTRMLLESAPVPDPHVKRPPQPVVPEALQRPPDGGCRFRARCTFAADICATSDPVLTEISPSHGSACHRWAELPAFDPTISTLADTRTNRRLQLIAERRAKAKGPAVGEAEPVGAS